MRQTNGAGVQRICLQRGLNGYGSECNAYVDENLCCCIEKTRWDIQWKSECSCSLTTRSFVPTARLLRMNFQTGESPNSIISWLFQKFLNTGSVLDHPIVRNCTAQTTTNCNCFSDSVDDAPCLSTRRHPQSLNLSQITIQCLLKELKLSPYHLSLLQESKPSDYPGQVNFCRWLLHSADDTNNISVFDTFFYSNKAWFHQFAKLPNMIIRKSLSVLWDWVTSAQNQLVVCGFSPPYCRPNFLWIDDYCQGVSRDYRAVHHFTRCRRARLSLSTGWHETVYHSGNHGLPVRVLSTTVWSFCLSGRLGVLTYRRLLPKRSNIPVASDNHHRIERENNAVNLWNYTSPASRCILECRKAVKIMHSGQRWSFPAPFVTFSSVFFRSYGFKYILII